MGSMIVGFFISHYELVYNGSVRQARCVEASCSVCVRKWVAACYPWAMQISGCVIVSREVVVYSCGKV